MNKVFIRIGQLLDALVYGLPMTWYLLHRNKKTVYYIPHVGIGDYCTALGYLDAYRQEHNIAHITLVAARQRKEICGFFSGYDELLFLSKRQYTGLVYLASIPGGRFLHSRCRRIENVSYTQHMSKELLLDNPALHVNECTKIILKISGSSALHEPEVPAVDIEDILKSHPMEKGKTVLLNPFTSGVAVKELDAGFYEELAAALKKKGFTVLTLLASESQQPVKGTEAVMTTLAEAWNLAQWCGWVIGTRSGFFDLIQYCDANCIVLYHDGYRQRDFFALAGTKNRPCQELVFSGNADETIKSIEKRLNFRSCDVPTGRAAAESTADGV